MEGHDGDLDRESDEKSEESRDAQRLGGDTEGARQRVLVERRRERHHAQVRDVRVEVEREDTYEHHERRYVGVYEELHRGVPASFATPDSDEEVHRDEHPLPEDVEREEVERHEDTDERRLQKQDESVESALPVLYRGPCRHYRRRRQQSREQDKRHRDTVETDEVLDLVAAHLEPGDAFHELCLFGVRERVSGTFERHLPDVHGDAQRDE